MDKKTGPRELRIWGASDDLIEVRGVADGELGTYGARTDFLVGEGNSCMGVSVAHTARIGWVLSTWMPDCVKDERNWAPPACRIVPASAFGEAPYSPAIVFDDVEVVTAWDAEGKQRDIR